MPLALYMDIALIIEIIDCNEGKHGAVFRADLMLGVGRFFMKTNLRGKPIEAA